MTHKNQDAPMVYFENISAAGAVEKAFVCIQNKSGIQHYVWQSME
jgi:hypothetical protein